MGDVSLFLFLLLGLVAGALTTVAGQGGGLLLLIACSALVGPRAALAITAPALLFGNLHRALLLRKHLDRSVALRLIAGALPGALAGGLAAGVTPGWVLRVLLVVLSAAAIAKALGLLRFRVSVRALAPVGMLVGAMTGTSGGAGILFSPVLLAAGLTGRVFVATSSTVALATHIGRVIGYATQGFFTGGMVVPTLAVSIALLAGNAFGDRLRTWLARMGHANTAPLEYGVLVVCVLLSSQG